MSRKRTGLRNKFRNGRGTYSIKGKSRQADTYGSYERGKQTGQDIIAGHLLPLHVPTGTPTTSSKDVVKRTRRILNASE